MAGKKRYGSRANHYRAVKFCKRTRENSFKSAILKKSGFFKTELREEKKRTRTRIKKNTRFYKTISNSINRSTSSNTWNR